MLLFMNGTYIFSIYYTIASCSSKYKGSKLRVHFWYIEQNETKTRKFWNTINFGEEIPLKIQYKSVISFGSRCLKFFCCE